jgi:4-amino-4-deoxy-L-arabinose transferase-like glycosyltransferase
MQNLKYNEHMIHRISTLLLISFLVLRSFLALLTIEFPEGGRTLDSRDYIDLSQSFRYNGTFTDSEGSADLRRPPVYPVFLALFQSSAGLHQALVSLAQLVLASLMSLVVLWFLNRRGMTTSGHIAGWLIAISPNINLWSLTIMSEVLFALLLILAFTIFITGLNRISTVMIFFAGVILGLATLTRPIGLVVLFLWVLFFLIASMRGWIYSRSKSKWIWVLVGSATVILPWMVRNAVIHQSFTVSDIGSHTLESFNFAIVLSEAEGISRNDATYQLGELGGTWDQFSWLIARYPLQFVKSQLAGVSRVLWGSEITRWATVCGHKDWAGFGIFRYLRIGELKSGWDNLVETIRTPSEFLLLLIYIINILYTLFLLVFSIASNAAIKKLDIEDRTIVTLCTITVLGLVLISGAAGQARFRVPVEPFLAVIAGLGWWQISVSRDRRTSKE